MKKITIQFLVFLALAFSWQANAQCNYTLEMNDSWGDGWNGNTMDVLVNSTPVLSGVTLNDGEQGLLTFSVNTGDDVTTVWNGGGAYGSETSYRILDFGGVEVGTGAQSDITSGTITAACPSCTIGVVASETINEDCLAGTYTITVEFSTVGDATGVSDGAGTYPITGTTAVAGPYTIGSEQDLTVIHSSASCDFALGTFVDDCPTPVTCGTPLNQTFCYGPNDTTEFVYKSNDGSNLKVIFNAGDIESCCDDLVIFDSDGVTELYRGANGGDLTGLEFTASGDTITVAVDSDGSVQSCATVTGADWDWDVICLGCTPGEASVTLVEDCANETYTLEVVVTNQADALTVTDGTASEVFAGTVVMGPYAFGTATTLTVEHADVTCNYGLGTFNINACPPPNDECADAIGLTVNTDLQCGTVTSGTVFGATDSGNTGSGCFGTPNDDVWYSFVATSTEHTVSLINIAGNTTDLYHAVYNATPGCGSLGEALVCRDPNSTELTGLTIGQTYYIQVYTWGSTPNRDTTFDICVGTAPTCYVPEDLAASFVSPDGANLSWSAPTDGTTPVGYNWEIVPQGNAQGIGVIDSGSVTATSASATGLTTDTLYDLYVQSDCGAGDLSGYAGPFTFNAGYCLPSGTNTSTYINDFTATGPYTNISNLGSGLSTNNYGDFYNTQAIEVVPGMSFDFSTTIVSGTVGSTIWIDWNNDFVFDQATETMFTTTSFGNGPFTGSITVPAGIADGDYRMRVMIDWNDSNPSEDACALNFGRGEVEDYKVTVNATLSADSFNQIAFNYYPNPVSNVLTIKGQQTIEKVSVYNMLGQTVLNTTPNAATSQVDMSALQAGAYFVKVTIANSTETIRIIKN
ncbi:GEVED domain-containing protein [Bizionia sediminis]|uniref:GEVED domain-containing protein n=1 Tax=Bizionia sediminis TaxID=1737064 RepID=A0ABW5KW52_9FLAO